MTDFELELRDEKLSDGSVVYNLDLVERCNEASHVRISLAAVSLDSAIAAQHKIRDAIADHTCQSVKMYDYLRYTESYSVPGR